MQIQTDDIVALLQLAATADIKASQAMEVAQLFQRVQASLNAAVVAAAKPVAPAPASPVSS